VALEELNNNEDIYKAWKDIKDGVKPLAGRMFTTVISKEGG
jgi:hypothetical protein